MQLSEAAWVGLSKLTREHKEDLVEAYAEKARRSFRNYCAYMDEDYTLPPHVELITKEVQELIDGTNDRLILTVPPRHSKSETISRKLPAYWLGRFPNNEIILTSYSFNLAKGFSRNVRDQLNDSRYQTLWSRKLKKDMSEIGHWGLQGYKGGLLASGVGGSITGHGADLFIIDDPFKGMKEAESELQRERVWEWYQSVVLTRLHPGAKMVIILTRWHRDDLVGRILDDAEERADWKVVNLPALIENKQQRDEDPLKREIGMALWGARYCKNLLEKLKRRVGSKVWHSLYQGNPRDPEECKFQRVWFEENMYDELPPDCFAYGGIDTASSQKEKADNMAFVTIYRDKHDQMLYVHDVVMDKYTNSAFAKIVVNKDRSIGNGSDRYAGIRLENNNGGEWVRQRIKEVAAETGSGRRVKVTTVHTSTDKMVRAMEWQHLVETGKIKWNRNNPKVRDLIQHLIDFDGKSGILDDVDACGFAIKAASVDNKKYFYSVTPDYDPTDIF